MEMELTQNQPQTRTDVPPRTRPPRLAPIRAITNTTARLLLGALSIGIVLLVLFIIWTLLRSAWPLIAQSGLYTLLTGDVWQPQRGLFGFAPFLAGSVAVTIMAMALAVVPAVLSGIYLAEYTTTRVRSILKPMLDLLVGIPSVIFGVWGILIIVPLIREHVGPWVGSTLGQMFPIFAFSNPSGYSVLAAGMVLAVMVFPLIVAVVDEVMRSAPREMREALLSLGATKWEATKCVVRRRGMPGVLAAVVLAFSRAFGETLAVLMVVGNVPQVPQSIFAPAYPLPALIANNYGEMMSIPMYQSAMMAAALLLLVVVLVFNVTARAIIVRMTKGA